MAEQLSRRDLLFLRLRRSQPSEPPRAARPAPRPEWLPPYLRPPGARPEDEFIRLCDGCGDCKSACPENAILPLGPAYGDADGTPAILPTTQPCRLCHDMPCITACGEKGALRPLPMEQIRMGDIEFHGERCWAVQGQPCDYCITACPVSPPALRASATGIDIDQDTCLGCGLCIYYCTATPRALDIAQPG